MWAAMRIVSETQLRDALAALAGEEPRVITSGNHAVPQLALRILDEARERYRLFVLAAQGPLPRRDGVIFETPFVGPGMRGAGAALDYLPMRLSLVPRLFDTLRPPDVLLLNTTPECDGRVSMGVEVNILLAALERVRARGGLVVAQLNPSMPYTLGDGELDCELVDLAIEGPAELPSPASGTAHAEAELIAARVAELVADGATLQLGIGQIPDATLRALAGRRRLGVWSEMISDGVMELERQGSLDPRRPIVSSFLSGTPALYEWADRNPRLLMRRTETTNDTSLIASMPGMVSINSALQLDIADQAGASHVGGRIYSGFGGQPDFVAGAVRSPGGHAVIALRSWHDPSDSSTIVPRLSGPVTSFQHSAVVTEQGTAHIFGRSQRAQARLIIERAAHPDAREKLYEQAAALGLGTAAARSHTAAQACVVSIPSARRNGPRISSR
jgi:acyl-CoA hydrolase